jgi:hypothetical protein
LPNAPTITATPAFGPVWRLMLYIALAALSLNANRFNKAKHSSSIAHRSSLNTLIAKRLCKVLLVVCHTINVLSFCLFSGQ